MKIFFAIIGGFLALILIGILFGALIFGLQYLSILNFGFFAPKIEAVKRQVFVNTPSFILGKEQEIAKYRGEYLMGDEDKKAIIKSVLSQTLAGVDRTQLSPQSNLFIDQLGL